MPSLALRALRALFPIRAIPVSTVPTQPQAHALAALLVSQGRSVVIAPADRGYIVSEVAA